MISDGKIYALDSEVKVTAYDAKTGDDVWSVDLTPNDEDAEDGFGGGITADGGRVFVSTGFGFVVALDAK